MLLVRFSRQLITGQSSYLILCRHSHVCLCLRDICSVQVRNCVNCICCQLVVITASLSHILFHSPTSVDSYSCVVASFKHCYNNRQDGTEDQVASLLSCTHALFLALSPLYPVRWLQRAPVKGKKTQWSFPLLWNSQATLCLCVWLCLPLFLSPSLHPPLLSRSRLGRL